jgi:hypothetical protein
VHPYELAQLRDREADSCEQHDQDRAGDGGQLLVAVRASSRHPDDRTPTSAAGQLLGTLALRARDHDIVAHSHVIMFIGRWKARVSAE